MKTPDVEKSDPRRPTRARVAALYATGATVVEIAAALQITRARVYQLLADLRRKGEL
jgi:DNA-binding CsgD family transcriptional regulator